MASSVQWHRTHYRAAVVATFVSMAALFLVVPDAWLRWLFHRDFSRPRAELAPELRREDSDPIRLIPVEMLPPRPVAARIDPVEIPLRREVLVPERRAVVVDDEDPAGVADSPWTWDPTSAYSITDELTRTRPGESAADSLVLRATLLRALRLGDLDPALAMLDTTQAALAHEQFREVDRWIVRHWAGIWKAQGDAARRASIYERAVLEAERDKGM